MRTPAPIVLFVYKRPWHTLQTLEALSKNELADQSTLYIFCDGPGKNATPEDIKQINEVKAICAQKQWAKEVIIEESGYNKGLATSVIQGVTRVVNQHDKVIVVEDDLVTSPGFLRYMNNALDHHASSEKVMHVSGYWFPVKKSQEMLPDTFYYRSTTCWGWGTWKRAWQKLETDAYELKKKIGRIPGGIKRFNIEHSYNHLAQLEANIIGKMDTWAVKWYSTVFLNEGLCLHPNVSFVNNIGFDNSGTHCDTNPAYHWPSLAEEIPINDISTEESKTAIRLIRSFHRKVRPGIYKRIKDKIRRTLQK